MSDPTSTGPTVAEPTVPQHRGDPFAEQRAMARSAAVVDRDRGVITVSGADRLSWLHLLLTQHVSELPDGAATESLVLDAQGRVLHQMGVAHLDGVVHLDTAPDELPDLLAYLRKMVFWSQVELRDASAELVVLTVVGPEAPAVLTAAGVPVPARPLDVAAVPGGGLVRRAPWPGPDAADLVVPRDGGWFDRLTAAGARGAGSMAFEAMRVESLAPRVGVDTDDRTIPHETRWVGPAVHLTKGCYRGQETVARVANLGRPPRRLVLLHLDSGDEHLPVPGDPVLHGARPVGRVGSVVQHHELGPVALALVKRTVPLDADLVAGVDERAAPARIDPDSVPPEDDAPAPGRAARERLRP